MLKRFHEWLSTSSWTLRGRVNQLHAKVDRLAEAVDGLVASQKQNEKLTVLGRIERLTESVDRMRMQEEKWRGVFRRQMSSVIRHFYLADEEIAAPHALSGRRFRLRSQNEEDGIVLALLKAGGFKTRSFVEIGSGGTGGNSAVLAADFGWRGLMVDASYRAVEKAGSTFKANPAVKVVRAFVTPENIDSLLREHGFSGEIDLFSLDIDSIDYWVFEALSACQPRVVVIEYNAAFGSERAVTIPNAPPPPGAPRWYAGASLAALEKLAGRKGYRLVVCEDAGINAFFLRNDLAPGIPGLSASQAWRPMLDRTDAADPAAVKASIGDVIRQSGLPLVDV